MNAAFVLANLGKPWQPMARGPAAFDCWGLVWHYYKTCRGIELPLHITIDPSDKPTVARTMLADLPLWQALPAPQAGCVVAMRRSQRIHHVGLYVDDGHGVVLHAGEQIGVVAEPVEKLTQQGWHLQFYSYKKRGVLDALLHQFSQ